MYRAKIATLEEEAIRLRVGARFLGVCHVKDRKDSEFRHHKPLSFPKQNSCFWVPHSGLGLLLSEDFEAKM